MSALLLFACAGGDLLLPALGTALLDRADGGNLVVNPPRPVWERSALSAAELSAWGQLVAAAGEAMLTALPQLEGGCINYWEAGNWALNDAAEPVGAKTAPEHRQVHMHLLGRSRFTQNPDCVWGEAPRFPAFAERARTLARNLCLTADECAAIVAHAETILREKFSVSGEAWRRCQACAYPMPAERAHACRV